MDFTITITDPARLAGITWAREQSNLSRAADEQFATDQDYVAWVVTQAAASYARDRAAAGIVDAVKAADEGDLTKLDEVRAEYAAKEPEVRR